MLEIIGGLIGLGFLVLAILMCRQESKIRKINFWVALLICFLTTPIFGYFIISSFALRNPIGCQWCGNSENEVEFCGVCGKNTEGITEQELKQADKGSDFTHQS
ncbi:MAG: hypothetical protein PSX81_08695 [bacterium]|nr:hypothetical protein [bacterium]